MEELERCRRPVNGHPCGALAQIHIWPDSREISYVVDCLNPECNRIHTNEPKYPSREEAAAKWNEQQRAL